MHIPYEILKGITLPGEFGMVSGRIYNYLRQLNEKIKPASCITIELDTQNIGSFYKKIGVYLTESAGVSIVIDNYKEIHDYLMTFPRNGSVTVIDSSTENTASNFQPECYEKVADSLNLISEKSQILFPDHVSIFSTFSYAFDAVLHGSHVCLDFAQVRQPDELSSGRKSFMALVSQIAKFTANPSLTEFLKCISDICSTIKRGGFRRHGAVTSSLKSNSPLINEYLEISFGYLTHLKKGVSITDIDDISIITKLLEHQNKGEIFFEKPLGTSQGWNFKSNDILYAIPKELRTNVCRGLALLPDDQCLVSPVNLGMCHTFDDIVIGFIETTQFLIDVHKLQTSNNDVFNLKDKQIAVGICGLANLLRNFNVSYPDFIEKLHVYRYATQNNRYPSTNIDLRKLYKHYKNDTAFKLVVSLAEGIVNSAAIGERHGMRATIAIEPNESCSRRYKDYKGFDLCPNIDPPNIVPGIGIERRHSQTGVFDNDGNLIEPEFNYGSDIYPAQHLSEQQHFLLWDNMLAIIEGTGQGHSGSYEMWGQWDMVKFLQWWDSSIKFVYYNRTTGTNHLVKGQAISARQRMKKQQNCDIGAREAGCVECD